MSETTDWLSSIAGTQAYESDEKADDGGDDDIEETDFTKGTDSAVATNDDGVSI